MNFTKDSFIQQGMNMIEVMIAVSILSVIILSTMMLTDNLTRQTKTSEVRSDLSGLENLIIQNMSTKAVCSATIRGLNLANNALVPISGIKKIDSTTGTVLPNLDLTVEGLDTTKTKRQIVGMYVVNEGNTLTGANVRLGVTVVLNPKAEVDTRTRNTFTGVNTKLISYNFQVDNCRRILLTIPKGSTPPGAPPWSTDVQSLCATANNATIPAFAEIVPGTVQQIQSTGGTTTFNFQLGVCRICDGTRVDFWGCL